MTHFRPLPTTPPSDLFARFIQFVEAEHPSRNGPLTVKDLRAAIRQENLTELSSWSFQDLVDVEEESASYGTAIVLTNIVSSQTEQSELPAAACASR